MCHRFIGGALLAAASLLAGTGPARAQVPVEIGSALPGYITPYKARATDGDIGLGQVPLNTHPTIPIPTGYTGSAGFYTAAEFVLLSQTRTIGDQTVAFRGLVDSTGVITGLPGTYIGSGQPALTTDELGRRTFQPGWRIELGYKFEDGTRVYGNFLQLVDAHYSAGATQVPPFFRSRRDLTDTFLVAGVFNFPPEFAGPGQKTGFDAAGATSSNTYGIWNGASVMDIKFTQRYTESEVGLRMPVFQTDYSRVYGMAGGRFAWFFERFYWRTVSFDINGNTTPQFAADYTNTLSQRMYGPFVGCGHEVFLANQFSCSLDLTAALLLSVVKERVKYDRGDDLDPAKRGWQEYDVVPNFNAALNLWWYPIEGVQVRIGYNAMTYFNTRNMLNPIGFNYGAIDPVYETQVFRLLHGVNFGVGLFF
jgi:hypothetical protein